MSVNRVKIRSIDLRLPKAPDLLAQQIRESIVIGRIATGAMLPSEKELASQLGLSRPTVREALHILEAEGLVTIKPGPKGGATVKAPSYENVTRLLALTLRFERTTLAELIEARKAIEPWCAYLSAIRAQEQDIEAIRVSVERSEEGVDDPNVYLSENRNFHVAIAQAARNKAIRLYVSSLRDMTYEPIVLAELDIDGRRPAVHSHRLIYEAIAAHDAERAQEAMEQHLDNFEKHLADFFGDIGTRLMSDKMSTASLFEIDYAGSVRAEAR